MRFILSFLIGVTLSLTAAAAPKSKSKFKVQFLTFNQMMALPQAKRVEYMRDITKLMITMEKYNSRYEVAGLSIHDLKEQIAFFQETFGILPEADADTIGPVGSASTASGAVPLWDGEEYVCRNGYELNKSIPACLKISSAGTSYFPSSKLEGGGCGADFVEIPHPDMFNGKVNETVVGCISKRNIAMLDEGKRNRLIKGENAFVSPNHYDRLAPEQQAELLFGGNKGKRPDFKNPIPAGSDSDGAPVLGGGASVAGGSGGTTGSTGAPGGAVVTPAGPATGETAKPETAKPEVAKPEAAKPDAAKPEAEACIPEPSTCPDKPDPEVEKRFRSSAKYKGVDMNKCIASGFMSRYEDGTKKLAGTCNRVTKFGVGENAFKCDKGFVLCNPALFCHTVKKANGKKSRLMYCVNTLNEKGKKDPNWTERCAQKFEKRMSATTIEDLFRDEKTKKIPQEINLKNYAKGKPEVEACKPEDFPRGANEDWDKLADSLKEMVESWCGGTPDFKVMFCKECQIITNHVYKMHKKIGKACGPSSTKADEGDSEESGDDAGEGESGAKK